MFGALFWPSSNHGNSPPERGDHGHVGELTRVTRGKGDASNERAADYASDGHGRVRQETQYPNWPATTSPLQSQATYDARGRLATTTDQLGQTKTYSYDNLSRLTGISYSDGTTPNVSFTYDANGKVATLVDGTGTTTYSYDELNRLLAVTTPGPKTVGYRYDKDGNRSKLIYPDSKGHFTKRRARPLKRAGTEACRHAETLRPIRTVPRLVTRSAPAWPDSAATASRPPRR